MMVGGGVGKGEGDVVVMKGGIEGMQMQEA